MSHYEKLKAMKTGFSDDFRTAIYAQSISSKDYERYISGEPPLILSDSVGKPLVSWSITGNTVQDGEPTPTEPIEVKGTGDKTGNLANVIYGKVPTISNGSLVNFDGVTTEYISTKSSTDTFRLSFVKSNGDNKFSVFFYSGDTLITTKDLNTSQTITRYGVSDTVDRIRIRIDLAGNSVSNIMLNSGSEPLPYEPYGYKVTEATRGKNLFDVGEFANSTTEQISSGLAFSISNQEIFINGKSTGEYPQVFVRQKNHYNLKLSNGIQYYCEIVKENAPTNSNIYLMIQGYNGTTWSTILSTATKSLFNSGNYQEYRYLLVAQGDNREYNNCKIKIAISPNDIIYEPYIEPITTPIYLSSPLMADEVLKSEGKREVEWGKRVLTGDEPSSAFRKNSTSADNYLYYTSFAGSSNKINGFCSHLPTLSYTPANSIGFNTINNYNAIYMNFGADIMEAQQSGNTIDGLLEYLKSEYDKGTPVTVYYPLATPTSETVDVPQIPTLKGTTVIDVDTEVKPKNMTLIYKSGGKL